MVLKERNLKDWGRNNWPHLAAAGAFVAIALSAGLLSSTERTARADEAASVNAAFTPPPPVPTPEMMRLRDGVAAAESRDWVGLALARDTAVDPIVRSLLEWRFAVENDTPADFNTLRASLERLEAWPRRQAIRARAEEAIFVSSLNPQERIAFLREDDGPVSGDGRIALAQALRASGQRSEAIEIARTAWREDRMEDQAESIALREFGDSFSADDHATRVDILLWRGQRSDARALYSRISSADRLLAEARIALQTRQRRGLQAAVDAVPDSRANNPGLVYDRARYIRRSGRPERAMDVAAEIDSTAAPLAARDEIFDEKRLYVPRALRGRDYRLAYRLVSNHGMSSGVAFADAEWLSGWISLRYLDNARQAAGHFQHLDENVSSSVSSSRAQYWRGVAAAALGDSAEAQAQFRRAAQYDFTYYGQLALEKLGGGEIALPSVVQAPTASRTRFENRDLVRALRAMAQVGDRGDFESIAYHLDDQLEDPYEIQLLAELARTQGYNRAAVRSGKAGLFRGVVAAEAAYPLIDLPPDVLQRARPEPALVLSVIRQESEFDIGVSSHANAHGLMQLLPSTARLVARREGITYDRASLNTDPEYNVRLGSAYLGGLIDDYSGSYVLALVAYNAGPSRARDWIEDWGDPRSPSTDVVDWVELIPFSETRNYVQRIMENLQIYRHRLAGQPTPVTLTADLQRGR